MGSRGRVLPFMTKGTRRGWRVSAKPQPLFTPRKDPVPIVQEAGWAPGPVWTCAENLAPPPGFNPQTVQPVASRYTDWATRPTSPSRGWVIKLKCYFTLLMCHAMLRFNIMAHKHIRNTDFFCQGWKYFFLKCERRVRQAHFGLVDTC
jgi:hypothetical protein